MAQSPSLVTLQEEVEGIARTFGQQAPDTVCRIREVDVETFWTYTFRDTALCQQVTMQMKMAENLRLIIRAVEKHSAMNVVMPIIFCMAKKMERTNHVTSQHLRVISEIAEALDDLAFRAHLMPEEDVSKEALEMFLRASWDDKLYFTECEEVSYLSALILYVYNMAKDSPFGSFLLSENAGDLLSSTDLSAVLADDVKAISHLERPSDILTETDGLCLSENVEELVEQGRRLIEETKTCLRQDTPQQGEAQPLTIATTSLKVKSLEGLCVVSHDFEWVELTFKRAVRSISVLGVSHIQTPTPFNFMFVHVQTDELTALRRRHTNNPSPWNNARVAVSGRKFCLLRLWVTVQASCLKDWVALQTADSRDNFKTYT